MKDYEKLYKDALVNATREYDSAQTESTRAVIKNIFPELAESNDERIWKEMLDFFCQFEDKTLRGVDVSSWISWLEKQKAVEWSEHQHKLLNYAISMTDDVEVKVFLESLRGYNIQRSKWSEEDEKMVESCLLFVNANRTHPLATKCIDWLKSLRPQNTWKPSDEHFRALFYAIEYFKKKKNNTKYLEALYDGLKQL